MSTRCNIAIQLQESDLDRELTYDDIHFLKTKKEYPFMEIYCHHGGTPENARSFFRNNGLTEYAAVLEYILKGDRSDFNSAYAERGEQWSENRPYMFASLDGDIPEQYYFIFKEGKWFYKERISANDQPMEWLDLEVDSIAFQSEETPDFAFIVNQVQHLVEELTNGKYTLQGLTKEMLKRK